MKKYKVVWEVSKSVVVGADNEEQAIEDVMSGNVPTEDIEEDEITTPAEAFEI